VIEGVYKWIGLVVGGLCALLATGALIQELRSSPDPGSVAFDLVFGAIAAAVSARSGYSLFRSGRREVSGGCLVITLVFGGLLLLTGALLYALSIDSVEPPSPVLIGVILVLGAAITVPSAVLLWLQRRQPGR
jgi:drug/metabolite transporter (DMT)-like permease